MRIDRVIVSSNANPCYLQYWPLVAKAWSDIGLEVWLAYVAEPGDINKNMLRRFGNVMSYRPIAGLPTGHMAKLLRPWTAMQMSGNSLLSDVDMVPLNGSYFTSRAALAAAEGLLLSYTAGAYECCYHRHPICYLLASGSTFRDLLNPDGLKLHTWFDSLRDEKEGADHKANPWETPFSDESLFQWAIRERNFEIRIVGLSRPWIKNWCWGRIDRASWAPEMLKEGWAIDAHMPHRDIRSDDIKPIVDHVGLTTFLPIRVPEGGPEE